MKVHPSWFIFFQVIVLGVSLVISTSSWFLIWLGFELSLLGFLPMFISNFMAIEGMIKYFLTQAAGSALFIASFMAPVQFSHNMILLSMLIKLGAFPFYHWVPSVMSALPWEGCALLSTLQKVAPLAVLSSASLSASNFILAISVLGILISGILGLNQTHLRPLMAYSSIAHTSWLLAAMLISLKLIILYFLIYSYLTLVLFFSFRSLQINKVTASNQPSELNASLALLMVTLAGLPPFSIFFLKVSILAFLSPTPGIFIPILLGTMLSIFYYLNFIIPTLMTYWTTRSPSPTYLKIHLWVLTMIYPILTLV